MDNLILTFGAIQLDWQTVTLSFILAFFLSSGIAFTYARTFQGLSFSRGLVQSMILGALVACLLMIAIGDNIARGIGIVGSLAIIRFRTNLREPRDLIFLFGSMGVGVAAGVQSFSTAAIGAIAFILAAVLLRYTDFGRGARPEGLLRFQLPSNETTQQQVNDLLARLPRRATLITLREAAQGGVLDCSYQIYLRRDGDGLELVRRLNEIEGVRGAVLHRQEPTVEV